MVGYGLVVTVMVMFVVICLTVSQISAISANTSQFALRKLRHLRISWRSLSLHLAMFLLTLSFSAVSLAGYFTSCSTFHHHVTQILQQKLNQAEWSTFIGPDLQILEILCSDWLNLTMLAPRSMP